MSAKAGLRNQRVVVTRARQQAGKLTAAFEGAGAVVECLPLIEITEPADPGPLETAARQVSEFDWLALTSTNAVNAFFDQLQAPVPAEVRVAVIGPATARAVMQRGALPTLVASRADAEGLVADMAPDLDGSERVLVPRADDGRRELIEGLEALGARVLAVDAYSKRLPETAAAQALELFGDGKSEKHEIGWVTFTSPRIVRHFVGLFGEAWDRRRDELRAVSIGPVTTRELQRQGISQIAEAARPSPDEMVAAVSASL